MLLINSYAPMKHTWYIKSWYWNSLTKTKQSTIFYYGYYVFAGLVGSQSPKEGKEVTPAPPYSALCILLREGCPYFNHVLLKIITIGILNCKIDFSLEFGLTLPKSFILIWLFCNVSSLYFCIRITVVWVSNWPSWTFRNRY